MVRLISRELFILLHISREHTGIEMHYDGCDITWQLMLSDLSEYNGGGTYIRALRKTLKLRQGQVLVHPGEMYHKGLDIAGGTRVLMVCFMDGFDPGIVDRSDPTADRTEFEENVYMF
jgi:predicted 2-oxoglutarate/Fe(II)-dependent dioxygenase YbiX